MEDRYCVECWHYAGSPHWHNANLPHYECEHFHRRLHPMTKCRGGERECEAFIDLFDKAEEIADIGKAETDRLLEKMRRGRLAGILNKS